MGSGEWLKSQPLSRSKHNLCAWLWRLPSQAGGDPERPHVGQGPVGHFLNFIKVCAAPQGLSPGPRGGHNFRSPLAPFEVGIVVKKWGFSGCVCER